MSLLQGAGLLEGLRGGRVGQALCKATRGRVLLQPDGASNTADCNGVEQSALDQQPHAPEVQEAPLWRPEAARPLWCDREHFQSLWRTVPTVNPPISPMGAYSFNLPPGGLSGGLLFRPM